ncbi:tripartite-type tricarboxylate transporter receptor subunit TctC [Acidovorax delafieldii]|jgi:tripartite-type tricarboxylate transporter receptor subunit TctC|uniref:Tripartite-type tricarboxylate transporter receptor subunit TctC n=1 Tax=Acidovorax delafieldii TaxID=47920 RepID=A0AAJ2BWI0_ACIDE|nr:tripartite tricarboxylate transporter substrate binding protein [Acidovorax delafieldii]MDR6765537.1 tripartite-type tricarboxylate transporter receptor subunit TctC [Acidovorax delafieldii]MDR6835975.1 tripartite-type tricarboxylate transporter receptor subunit TctC [Acidovorax delafieldii]MDR7365055.1 tripartite-type tricarboxylate transporter receptor subunit TctC [Acidovorax delafieldii]
MQRQHFLRAAVGAVTLAMAASSFAQAYPTKPIRMIIPFPPGGTLDTVGRQLAQKLGEQMGQNFIVENKPGGNGVIGGDVVAKAPADGYTLLFNASTFTTAPMTMKSVPYGVVKDFTPVALVAKAPLSVAINKNLPVTDIKSLMAYAKANPGKMTFAVGSIGSAGHLSTELLKRAGNLDYLIVPYKGTAPAFQDLIGGQIDGFIDPILGSLQYHKSGMLRVVAVTSAQRAASLPDVPTVGETIPGYEFYSWYGLWGPAKLPADITQRLNTEVNKALAEMTPKLKEQGLLTTPGSVEDFAKFQRSDMERSQKIVTEGNIRVE